MKKLAQTLTKTTKNGTEYKEEKGSGWWEAGKTKREKELQQESGNSTANLTPNVTHWESWWTVPPHAPDPQNKINTQFSPR